MILFTQNVQRAPQKCILNGMEMTSNKTKKKAHNHPVSPTTVVMLNIYWWNGISYRNWMTKQKTHTHYIGNGKTCKLVESWIESSWNGISLIAAEGRIRKTHRKQQEKEEDDELGENKKINAKNVTRKSHF